MKFLGIKIERNSAFQLASIFYVALNVLFFTYFSKLHFLIKKMGQSRNLDAINAFIETLIYSPWLLNPFSYFTSSLKYRWSSGFSLMFFVVLWWICNGSLYALLDKSNADPWFHLTMVVLFLLIGLITLKEIVNMIDSLAALGDQANSDPRLKISSDIKAYLYGLGKFYKPLLMAGAAIGCALALLMAS